MPAIHCYRSPKIEFRESGLDGRGVFAVDTIRKDEIVAIKAGHIVNSQQVKKFTEKLGDFSLQIHDDFFLTPTTKAEVGQTTIFINHSCDANIGFRGQVVYVAMREIKAGEELCHDYAMARTDNYQMHCRCGSSDCRRIVTGDDWRNKAVQQKYGDYFVTYVLEKINGAG